MKKRFIILSTALFSFFAVMAQSKTDSLDLYLLVGQSNMAGRGEMSGKYLNDQDSNVLMLTKDQQWVIAKHPIHFDKPAAGVGLGLSFGKAMLVMSKEKKIGLIPCAVGGTSIDVWQPGGFDKGTNTHPYDDTMERLRFAMQSGTVKGVIWLQGEADSGPAKLQGYMDKLITLIKRLREATNDVDLPFVAGQLGQFKEQYRAFNTELDKLPTMVLHTGVVSSEGFIDKGDQTHFDAKSMDEYGTRFAEKMKYLLKSQDGNKN